MVFNAYIMQYKTSCDDLTRVLWSMHPQLCRMQPMQFCRIPSVHFTLDCVLQRALLYQSSLGDVALTKGTIMYLLSEYPESPSRTPWLPKIFNHFFQIMKARWIWCKMKEFLMVYFDGFSHMITTWTWFKHYLNIVLPINNIYFTN